MGAGLRVHSLPNPLQNDYEKTPTAGDGALLRGNGVGRSDRPRKLELRQSPLSPVPAQIGANNFELDDLGFPELESLAPSSLDTSALMLELQRSLDDEFFAEMTNNKSARAPALNTLGAASCLCTTSSSSTQTT